jgi:hypothetical protein
MRNRDENLAHLTALKESMEREKIAERLFPDNGRWHADEIAKRRKVWNLFNASSQKMRDRDLLVALLAKLTDESVEWVEGVLLEARQIHSHPIQDQLTDSIPSHSESRQW